MNRPTLFPWRSLSSAKRPAVTQEVCPGSVRYTKTSEVIVKRPFTTTARAFAPRLERAALDILGGIREIIGGPHQVIRPQQRPICPYARARSASLRVTHCSHPGADFCRGGDESQITAQASNAQTLSELFQALLDGKGGRGLDDVALGHALKGTLTLIRFFLKHATVGAGPQLIHALKDTLSVITCFLKH